MKFDIDYIGFRSATRYLKKENIYDDIVELIERHKSTGVSLIDFASLYHYVIKHKPNIVLECETGLSTHILAEALFRNKKSGVTPDPKLISMESEAKWHAEAIEKFPQDRYPFTEILLSETVEYSYSFVKGIVYKNTPELQYDFVFVDGPNPKDMCDMDFIRAVSVSDSPVSAFVDSRRTSCLAYLALLGRDKIVSYPFGFSLIEGVNRNDLVINSKQSLHRVYYSSLKMNKSMYVRGMLSAILLCLFPMRIFD